jgi:PAS domain S-box-containing protein
MAKTSIKKERRLDENIDELLRRLEEAEETLKAIREGEVDAIIVSGEQGDLVYSLSGTEQIYRLIVETMKEAALTVTLDGTILFCNHQFGQFLGLPQEKILGHSLLDFLSPEAASMLPDLMSRSVKEPVKQRLVFQNGEQAFPAHISANVLNQPDGLSICIVATDLTELETSTEMLQQLRRQQEALQASESRLRAVFTATRDTIVISDDEGRFIETNPAAATIFGLPADQLIGRRFKQFLEPGFDLGKFRDGLMRQGTQRSEIQVIQPEGQALLTEVFAVANILPGRHLAVLRDITDERRAEEALISAHASLEQKVEERTAELGKAVRDLRAEIERRRAAESLLQQANRILQMLSDCNQAIARIEDEQELMRRVCNIIVHVGRFRMALVGMKEDDPEKTIRTVATADLNGGSPNPPEKSWANTGMGRGPIGNAVHTGQPHTVDDYFTDARLAPWRDEAMRQGFRSAMAMPLRDGDAVIGVLAVFSEVSDAFRDPVAKVLLELTENLAFGVTALRTRRALHESRDRLRALAGELTLTERRERQRLAKILHDHIQQLLVGAKYRLHALPLPGNDAARTGVGHIEELLNECISNSRTLTAELSPPILQEGGLSESLEWLAEWMGEKHGLNVELAFQEICQAVPHDLKLLLFESSRELLFNVVKHAGVKSANVSLRQLGDNSLEIVVADKGVGFNQEKLKVPGDKAGGFGLFSIRHRMDLIGGKLQITSKEGEGTRLCLTIPISGLPS